MILNEDLNAEARCILYTKDSEPVFICTVDTAPFRNKLIDLLKSNGVLHKTSKEFDTVQIFKFSLLI